MTGRRYALLLLAAAAAAQEPIRGVKEVARELGLEETRNFQKRSDRRAAFYRCYYTGKLELPDSYDKLGLKQVDRPGCPIDEGKYDVFFYAAEAVANGSAPVTPALAEARIERQLVVAPHEDFHQSREARRAPPPLDEAAATLAGFLTAAEYARRRYGEESEVYRSLAREPGLFARKAEIVNRYHARLSRLYAEVRAGRAPAGAARVEKVRAFLEARRECAAIQPEPVSFNKCLSAENNAGLAFDYTYTREYPRFYRMWEERGRNAAATIEALRKGLQ